MPACPICAKFADARFQTSPYWMCPSCDVWLQSAPPHKVYDGEREKDAHEGPAGHLK